MPPRRRRVLQLSSTQTRCGCAAQPGNRSCSTSQAAAALGTIIFAMTALASLSSSPTFSEGFKGYVILQPTLSRRDRHEQATLCCGASAGKTLPMDRARTSERRRRIAHRQGDELPAQPAYSALALPRRRSTAPRQQLQRDRAPTHVIGRANWTFAILLLECIEQTLFAPAVR